MSHAVLGFDRGRHSTKATLVLGDKQFHYIAPSLAVPEPDGADPDGNPRERLVINGRPYLVGHLAQAASQDALFRTTGSKTQGQAAEEFRLSFMGVLAWAAGVIDLSAHLLHVVTSAPDSEYEAAVPGLKETLSDSFQFQTGDGRLHRVDVTTNRVTVARESTAPLWARTIDLHGDLTDSPFLWSMGGRPGAQQVVDAHALIVGIGFRDWNVATTTRGKRTESQSGVRGVSEIYSALWKLITGPEVGYPLRTRAELDQILNGTHGIWSNRNANELDTKIKKTVADNGRRLLDEAVQWAGSPDGYHAILAAGGGCLMLKELVREYFPKAVFAMQGDSANGLAFAGVRALKTAPK